MAEYAHAGQKLEAAQVGDARSVFRLRLPPYGARVAFYKHKPPEFHVYSGPENLASLPRKFVKGMILESKV